MTKKEQRNLTWKLKDLPSATELADLVEQGVLLPEEAREIVLGTVESDKGKIEALEKMVEFLQGLVTELSKKQSTTYVPYERNVYIDRTVRPYWDRYWNGTQKVLVSNGLSLSSTAGSITTTTANYVGGKLENGGGETLSLAVNKIS